MQVVHPIRGLTLILVLCLRFTIYSQDISFHYLGTNEGLSQTSVSSIVQDSLERLWIGTRDGLNIYDGTTIKTLRPIRGDSASLLGYFITKIVKDGNFLWIITKNGLSYLNIKTLKFKQYPIPDCNTVLPYQGRILVGTKDGLSQLNTNTKSFSKCTDLLNVNYSVQELYTDSTGLLWIGTTHGSYLYSPLKRNSTRVLDNNTTCIFTDSHIRTWIGTYNDGIYLLNNQQKQIKHFTHKKKESSSIINNIIRDIEEGPNGNIWVGTFQGLSLINGSGFKVTNYSHKNNNNTSLSHNSIMCILHDRQGSMWLGTYFGGISYYNSNFSLFQTYSTLTDRNNPLSLGFNVIGEMLEDADENLWIATDGGGVDCFNRTHKTFTHYPLEDFPSEQTHTNVKALAFMDQNHLMVGTHLGGLKILNTKTSQHKTYLPENNNEYSIPGRIIEDIIPFEEIFLLGTEKGVVSFNPKTDRFTNFIIDPKTNLPFTKRITSLYEDSYGVLWIGTLEQGLFAYHRNKKELKAYKSSPKYLSTISSNNISSIYEDHYFRLWFGTHGGGLNLYNRKEDTFSCLNMSNSNIPGNFIQGIKKSRLGNIWVASTKGLSILEVDNNHFINYSRQNGFPLDELNHRALYLTNDGEVFAGSIDGLTSFKEEALLKQSNNFNLIFTSLEVNGKAISPNDKSKILTEDLPYASTITLKANQNSLTINYSACNYISTNLNSYRYKLESSQDTWTNAGNKTSISYSNLNPGTYTLIVQAIDNNEVTVIDEKKLTIIVKPPLLLTWYAIIFYFLVALFLFWWLSKLYRARVKMSNQLESEKQEKEQIKQLNQSKLNFFTNVSHEFRTPLTLINGALETMLENPKTTPENLNLIKKTLCNNQRLNNLIDELLDFRTLENGNNILKVRKIEFNDFLKVIFQAFQDNARFREISYQFKPFSNDCLVWIDTKQMEKVFYNLISNAFKFTKDKTGKIEIETIDQENSVEILIRDNGIGIPTKEIGNIFNLYYQVDNLHKYKTHFGSGIGLAFSKALVKEHKGHISVNSQEGEGTTFRVSLLKGKTHFDKHVFIDDQEIVELNNHRLHPTNVHEFKDAPVSIPENAPTLLIVEDNIEVQEMLFTIFCSAYKIVTAKNGKEGLDLAIRKQPDLILSDVMMPVMSGTEMCSILKRNIDTSHIPIIILSAKASTNYRIEGLKTGADDYISKPFNTQLLKIRVKNIIQNRLLIQQKYNQEPQLKAIEIKSSPTNQNLLTKAVNIIYKNIDNPEFNIPDFASDMNLSKSKLYAKIKDLTGQTPNELILSTRMKKAAEMLTQPNSNITVAEIAYAVGYGDPRYFSKSFRQHFGVSPTKYGKNRHLN